MIFSSAISWTAVGVADRIPADGSGVADNTVIVRAFLDKTMVARVYKCWLLCVRAGRLRRAIRD